MSAAGKGRHVGIGIGYKPFPLDPGLIAEVLSDEFDPLLVVQNSCRNRGCHEDVNRASGRPEDLSSRWRAPTAQGCGTQVEAPRRSRVEHGPDVRKVLLRMDQEEVIQVLLDGGAGIAQGVGVLGDPGIGAIFIEEAGADAPPAV